MTNAERIQARIDAIYEELANLGPGKVGGKPNASGGTEQVDHQGYKKGLYQELKDLKEQLPMADGPWETTS